VAEFSKYRETIRKINFFLVVILAFSIPFHRLFSAYVFVLWTLSIIIEGHFMERISGTRKWGILILFILFFILHISGYFYSENTDAAVIDIVLKIPFLIMPLFLLLSSEYLKDKYNKVFLSFVAGNFLASVICLVAAVFRSISVINGNWTFNAELMDHNYSFWQMLANGGNNFMYEPLSVFIHPGYFSIFIVTSVLFLLDMLVHKQIGKTKSTKIAFISLILFFSIMIYLLFERTGLIALFVLYLGYFVYFIFKTGKSYYKLGFLFIVAIAGIILLGLNERMRNSLKDMKHFYSNSNANIDPENRLILWSSSLDIIKANIFCGVGTGDNKDKLIELYRDRGFKKAEEAKLNIHNQFIETTIQLGLLGLMALLALFIVPFIIAVRNKNILLLCFTFISGLFFLFESCLNRQAGVFYFVFFLSLIIIVRPVKNNIITSVL